MSVTNWLEMAKADAEKRGLAPVVPLLDGLARLAAGAAGRGRRPRQRRPGAGHSGDRGRARRTPGDRERRAEHGGQPRRRARPRAASRTSSRRCRAARSSPSAWSKTAWRRSSNATRAERLHHRHRGRGAGRGPRRRSRRAAGRHIGPLHGIPISLKDLIDQKGVPHHGRLAASGSRIARRPMRRSRACCGRPARCSSARPTCTSSRSARPARIRASAWRAIRTIRRDRRADRAAVRPSPSRPACRSARVGTDTGGSIRIPAAACGIVGLKPEWGEISASGVVPLSRQLDHVGPLARIGRRRVAAVQRDAPAAEQIGDALEATSLKGLRLGVLSRLLLRSPRRGRRARRARPRSSRCSSAARTVVGRDACRTPTTWRRSTCIWCFGDAAEYHARTLETRPQDYTTHGAAAPRDGALRARRGLHSRAARQARLIAREVDRALDGVDALVLPSLGDSGAADRRGHRAGEGRHRRRCAR